MCDLILEGILGSPLHRFRSFFCPCNRTCRHYSRVKGSEKKCLISAVGSIFFLGSGSSLISITLMSLYIPSSSISVVFLFVNDFLSYKFYTHRFPLLCASVFFSSSLEHFQAFLAPLSHCLKRVLWNGDAWRRLVVRQLHFLCLPVVWAPPSPSRWDLGMFDVMKKKMDLLMEVSKKSETAQIRKHRHVTLTVA